MTDLAPWLKGSRWPTVPIKYVARLGTGHTPSRKHPEYWTDCDIPWVTLADVWQLRDGRARVISETAEKISELGVANSSAVVHTAGTVILSRTASVGFSAILAADMATSQDFATWTCGPKMLPEYLLYVLRAMVPDLRRLAAGSTHKSVYMPDIERLCTPLPPIEVQRGLVKHLERRDIHTDELTLLLTGLRTELAMLRTARVHAAVSGAVYAVDRGESVPWTGPLPRHWQTAKLTRLARLGSGHTPSRKHPEWWTDCSVPWITTGEVAQIRDDRLEELTETRENISEAGLANSSAELHPAGTVVLCRTAASAGYSAVMGCDMATSQDFATWVCGPRLNPYYLLYCLRAMRPDLLGRLAQGSTHKTIYMPDIQSIRIPTPPLLEQQQIVAEIRAGVAVIDEVLDLVDEQLRVLDERRAALITAAVTGQLDVAADAA